MKKIYATLLSISALLLTPVSAFAAGLVTCGTGSGLTGVACQACDLVRLSQNILNFTIGLSIPIAMGLIAWSGVLYFTSNSNEQKLATAKKIFKSAFVGFLITISAWLFINTFLRIILDPGQFKDGSWFTVECVAASSRPINTSITEWLTKSLPGLARDPVKYGINSSSNPQFTQALQGVVKEALAARCAAGDQGSCAAVSAGVASNGKLSDAAREALLEGCDAGDTASCSALSKVAPESPLSSEKMSAEQAKNMFGESGVEVKNGVVLDGLREATIEQVVNLQQACGCNIVVTGAAEQDIHAGGTYSHGNGYKVDLRLSSDLNNYIESNLQRNGTRSDGAALYQDSYGNVYAREGNHWDIRVTKAGTLK